MRQPWCIPHAAATARARGGSPQGLPAAEVRAQRLRIGRVCAELPTGTPVASVVPMGSPWFIPRCQREAIVGVHSLLARMRGRIADGLGLRSGLAQLVRPRPPRRARIGAASRFARGDTVRVRSRQEIAATFDAPERLRGLRFVPSQWQTCGRVYRVAGSVRRIMDDHGAMRAVRGTVLLEGADCGGPGGDAGCGRACPLMYRDEWLEPTPEPAEEPAPSAERVRVRSVAAIRATLDRWGRRDGLPFMPEMAGHAGKTFPVVRRLSRVYEYDRWTPTRGEILLLGGLACSGAALGADGPCHRRCVLLWHADWLEPVAALVAATLPIEQVNF